MSGAGEESHSVTKPNAKKVYPPEFRAQVVELYRRGGRSFTDIAREFGLSATSVANWVRQAAVDAGDEPGLTTSEKVEVVELRRKLRQRDEEVEILGKALAFFARKTDR